jgi:hypothetical protein
MKISKKNKIRGLVAVMAVTGMMSTQVANALLPTTDAANLAQAISSNIQRAFEWAKNEAMQAAQMDLMSSLSGLQVDSMNNGFANMVARFGKTQQDIQNTAQLEKSVPAQDACKTITVSNILNDALCSSDSQVESMEAARKAVSDMSRGKPVGNTGKGPVVDDIQRKQVEKSISTLTTCAGLVDAAGTSLCEKPSLAISPPGGQLNASEYKAVMIQNEIAANSITPIVPLSTGFGVETGTYKQASLQDNRRENIRKLALASLDEVTMIREGTLEEDGNTRKPGELFAMQKFADDRFGSADWLCQVTNSCAEKTSASGYVSPDELQKRAAEMDAFMLHLSVQQFKQSLREEQLMANLVLINLDPVKNNRDTATSTQPK